MNPSATMQVLVHAPLKVYFNGPANSVSAANDTGPFDILPGHKNFMTLLKPGRLTVRVSQRPDFNLEISRGVMHVKADKVIVFLDV